MQRATAQPATASPCKCARGAPMHVQADRARPCMIKHVGSMLQRQVCNSAPLQHATHPAKQSQTTQQTGLAVLQTNGGAHPRPCQPQPTVHIAMVKLTGRALRHDQACGMPLATAGMRVGATSTRNMTLQTRQLNKPALLCCKLTEEPRYPH